MATVLVVEDEGVIRMIMARVIRRAGHTVTEAVNGEEGWQRIEQAIPDLVISDIDMPVWSGTDLCVRIRSDERTRNLPVLFVSGSLVPGDPRAVDAQATAVLRKPFTPAELVACLDKMMQTGHQPGQPPFACP